MDIPPYVVGLQWLNVPLNPGDSDVGVVKAYFTKGAEKSQVLACAGTLSVRAMWMDKIQHQLVGGL